MINTCIESKKSSQDLKGKIVFNEFLDLSENLSKHTGVTQFDTNVGNSDYNSNKEYLKVDEINKIDEKQKSSTQVMNLNNKGSMNGVKI